MRTATAEANGTHLWVECQDSVTQQQYYIKLLSGCGAEEICDWLGTRSRTEIWWFKNADFFPQLLSIPAMHSPISCYSFVPRRVFHFQGSLHYVSWKAEVLERSRGSWRSNSPVQQPGTKTDYSCSDVLPTSRMQEALLLLYAASVRWKIRYMLPHTNFKKGIKKHQKGTWKSHKNDHKIGKSHMAVHWKTWKG